MSCRVVSVERGEDLVTALRAAAREGEAWLQATGIVEAVELRLAGEGADPIRTLRGRLTLVALSGPAGGPYGATLARATDAGLEVLAGELVRARSDGVTAVVMAAERAGTTGEARPEPRPAGAAPAAKSTGSAWAAAALATARELSEPEPEPLLPGPGDLVQHFAFGLCEVLMGDDERLKIRDVSGPGRIREIRLDMLLVKGPSDREGKRLFKLDRKS
jgi:hypothetical protein